MDQGLRMPPLNNRSITENVCTLSKEPDIKVEFVKHIQPLFSQYCVAEIKSTFDNGMNLRQIPTLTKATLSIKKCSFRFFRSPEIQKRKRRTDFSKPMVQNREGNYF